MAINDVTFSQLETRLRIHISSFSETLTSSLCWKILFKVSCLMGYFSICHISHLLCSFLLTANAFNIAHLVRSLLSFPFQHPNPWISQHSPTVYLLKVVDDGFPAGVGRLSSVVSHLSTPIIFQSIAAERVHGPASIRAEERFPIDPSHGTGIKPGIKRAFGFGAQ